MDTKILAGVGVAALAIASGNQARRHQRQNAGNETSRPRNIKRIHPPLMQTQDSSMYHDEAAELAASISSYRYGAKMPGYLT